MLRYLKYYDYYLEIFAKRLSGRGLMNPQNNGEFAILKNVIKLRKEHQQITFFDGGANFGTHSLFFSNTHKNNCSNKCRIISVEPFPSTAEILKKNLKTVNCEILEVALGDQTSNTDFFFESGATDGGQNSLIKHYYLENKVTVKQTTIDKLVKTLKLEHIDFLKLDIEGAELRALMGAQSTLKQGKIDYIQLEYNQTWIAAGATIEKILKLAQNHDYELFRIRKNDLLAIRNYDFNLDDFFFCNLLLVKKGCELPLPCYRKASPLI